MSEAVHTSHKKEYLIIFFVLSLLTGLELLVPGLDTAYYLKATSLTVLAFGKAFLVGYYYMHLKDETKWMRFIALVPMFAVIYAAVVVIETLVR